MMRVCHLDTCPVGVATQNPTLRSRFSGKPEFVETFFEYLAEEVRELLAELGLRSLDEAIGRVDLIEATQAIDHWKADGLDLSPLLYEAAPAHGTQRLNTRAQEHGMELAVDHEILSAALSAAEAGERSTFALQVSNVNRAVGTQLGSAITRRFGSSGLDDDTIHLDCSGSAGQSFGAFLPRGITLSLEGDANDYLGKGLSGGILAVHPPKSATFEASAQVIAGNVIGYGATSGSMYLAGIVGERFCVRNSGATAVVEGVGDHACEYMTGGRVVVLGATGRNFGAGMSGGMAYVYDPDRTFDGLVNYEMVDLEPLTVEHEQWLRSELSNHVAMTGSAKAAAILENFASTKSEFVVVMPRDYKKVLAAIAAARAEGRSEEEAVMAVSHG
jgi:glutamate synthase (NADPH/NADH) large chain